MAGKKLTISDLYDMAKERRKITWITAYDYPIASFAQDNRMQLSM